MRSLKRAIAKANKHFPPGTKILYYPGHPRIGPSYLGAILTWREGAHGGCIVANVTGARTGIWPRNLRPLTARQSYDLKCFLDAAEMLLLDVPTRSATAAAPPP
jgi:hypothetical protein